MRIPQWLSRGVVSNAMWALIAAFGGALWAAMKAEPPHRVALFAVVAFAAVLFIIDRIRGEAAPAVVVPSDVLEMIGHMADGRVIVRTGQRVAELDRHAYEYYVGLDKNEMGRVLRSVAASRRIGYSRFDIIAIVKGNPIDDVSFPVRSRLKGVRFWTRSEISERPNDPEVISDAELSAWFRNTTVLSEQQAVQRRLRQALTDARRIIERGVGLFEPALSNPEDAVGSLVAMQMVQNRKPEWLRDAKDYL